MEPPSARIAYFVLIPGQQPKMLGITSAGQKNRNVLCQGRVIRSETDRGVVLLIDRRFGEARYRRLFPAHWRPVIVRHPTTLEDSVREFWARG